MTGVDNVVNLVTVPEIEEEIKGFNHIPVTRKSEMIVLNCKFCYF